MKPPPVISSSRPRTRRLWLWGWLAALLLLPLVVLAAGVASYFHLSSDTKALRYSLMKATGVKCSPQIVLNVGNVTLSAVRAGLSFVNLDAEARAALQAIRGAEVGIYRLTSEAKSPDRAAMLASADAAMSARGWDRVVGVLDGGDLVAIYLPGKNASASRMKCCVVVFDGQEMVVASAQANLEPLLQCVLDQPAMRAKARLLAKR